MIAATPAWIPGLLADQPQVRDALHDYWNRGEGGGERMMALLWLVAVLALAVIVLVIFERRRRARRKPDPRKLVHDLLGAEGLGPEHQTLLRELAAAGRIAQPALLLFSEATLRSVVDRYVAAARGEAETDRRRRRCAALVEGLFPSGPPAALRPAAGARPAPASSSKSAVAAGSGT